jgi:hypothetical protein
VLADQVHCSIVIIIEYLYSLAFHHKKAKLFRNKIN